MTSSMTSSWFEDTWRVREDIVYPNHFGSKSTGSIIPIPPIAFEQIGCEQVDPRWLHCGVLTFPPTQARASFTFVTSGLSNAWDADEPDPESISGLGIELRIDNGADEHWAKDVLLRLSAMQLLIGAGYLNAARLLGDGDRVRVGADTFGHGSLMTSLLATGVDDFHLPSGTFKMIQLFAITDSERDFAAVRGFEALLTLLRQNTTYPVNDIARAGVV